MAVNSRNKKIFEQQHYITTITKDPLIRYKCSTCNEEMGFSMKFIMKHKDLNYRYICPYCGTEGKINEENY